MSDTNGNGQGDEFLQLLEDGIRDILKNGRSSKADRLAAINAGVRVAAIKHKVTGGEAEENFFTK